MCSFLILNCQCITIASYSREVALIDGSRRTMWVHVTAGRTCR
jgi:hypothetical protein